MKKPRRRFVVEFKSSRRLQKTQATSIWGNTDLKALARELEGRSTHLFGAAETVVPETTKATPDTASQTLASEPAVEEITPAQLIARAMDGSNRLTSAPAVVDQVIEPAPTPIEPPKVSRTANTTRSVPRKRAPRSLPTPVPLAADELGKPRSSAATLSNVADDLAALDAESKRLHSSWRSTSGARMLSSEGCSHGFDGSDRVGC